MFVYVSPQKCDNLLNYNSLKMIIGNRCAVIISVLLLIIISGFCSVDGSIIIIEDAKACFRRTLAGKRVVRSLVRKLLFCDTVEQCQWECGDERRFTCEGFNYRLDPSGRGKGECELLALSLPQIDVVREIVTDPDYDYYTRDRNAAQVNCGQRPSNSLFSVYGDRRHGYYGNRRGDGSGAYDRRPTDIARPLRPPGERWDYGTQPTRPRPLPPIDQRPLPDGERNYEYGNRRGGKYLPQTFIWDVLCL